MVSVMSAKSVKVIEGGKLVIPAEFRREMGISAGDTVVVEIMSDGDLHVRPLAAAINRAQSIVREFAKGGASMADALIADRRSEAARE